jgi:hypothetical protein
LSSRPPPISSPFLPLPPSPYLFFFSFPLLYLLCKVCCLTCFRAQCGPSCTRNVNIKSTATIIFFLRGKPASYYSPDLFESVCAVRICPGEHILVSIEDHDILYTYNGQCCCGKCVSKTSNLRLT